MHSSLGWLKDIRGSVRVGLTCVLAALVLVPVCVWAAAPAWWAERGVLNPAATPDDYAVVNQGQVKHIARQAYEEFVDKLPNGPGATLTAIWASPAPSTDDYAAINVGQLKNVAKPFYDRLIAENIVSNYPWGGAVDDYALANIGQVKHLFSFSLGGSVELIITGGDRQVGLSGETLPDALEVRVINADGTPSVGQAVKFTVMSGGGGLHTAGTSSGGGVAQITVIAGVTGRAFVYLKPVNEGENRIAVAVGNANAAFRCYVVSTPVSSPGGKVAPGQTPGESSDAGGIPVDSSFYHATTEGGAAGAVAISVSYDVANWMEPHSSPKIAWGDVTGPDNYTIQRRENLGAWQNLTVPAYRNGASWYAYDAGLLCGNLYEYRINYVTGHGQRLTTRTVPYYVPMIKSYSHEYVGEIYPDHSPILTWTYGEAGRQTFGTFIGYFTGDEGYEQGIPQYTLTFNSRIPALPNASWMQYVYTAGWLWPGEEVIDPAIEAGAHSGTSLQVPGGDHIKHVIFMDSDKSRVLYEGAWLPSYVLKALWDGGGAIPLSSICIQGYYRNAGIFWTGDPYPGWYFNQYYSEWWMGYYEYYGIPYEFFADPSQFDPDLVMENDPMFSGSVVSWDNPAVRARVTHVYYDYESYMDGTSYDPISVESDLSNGGTVYPGQVIHFEFVSDTIDRDVEVTVTPVDTRLSAGTSSYRMVADSVSVPKNIPASESSGAKYRKIALNGAPLSDEKPQQEAETDKSKEETFIDALTLGLRHDTTDVYMAVPASDLALSVRRSVTSEVWNLKSGLSPDERPDRPFGAGWSTNLAANIHFAYGVGTANVDGSNPDTATVTDENGAEYTFAILYGSNVTYTPTGGYAGTRTFVPLPSSNHEQSIYVCSLTANTDGSYTFKRKFGTTLTYSMTDLVMSFPSDRVNGSSSGTTHRYAKLDTVVDRYGNQLNYEYEYTDPDGKCYTVVPKTISVHKTGGAAGATLSIQQDTMGRVTDIWDPSGYRIHYDYLTTTYTDPAPITGISTLISCARLDAVTAADGKQTHYAQQITPEADQNPREDASVGNHYHLELTGIIDSLGRTYSFAYQFDHTKYDYSTDAPGDHYYVKTGLPMQVSQTTLPGAVGAVFINDSKNLKVAEDPVTQALTMIEGYVRRNSVIDALGNQRDYDFTNVRVEELPSFATAYKKEEKFDNPRMVYYQTMTITPYKGSEGGKISLGGTEAFTFSPDAGMAVTSATDFSGNETSYVYTDPFGGKDKFTAAGMPAGIYGFYSDPTSQTNALNKTKVFTYDEDTRIMTSSKDENDTLTTWSLTDDATGRRDSETVTDEDGNVLSHTTYHYKDTDGAYLHAGVTYDDVSRNFLTKKVVKRNTASAGDPAWVAEVGDLVTLYVPDANGRVYQEAVDMNGNGTIDTGVDLVTTITYDANGNKLTTKDPRGNVTHFSYDKRNRLTHVTYADGHQKQLFYDARGNKTQEIDENGVATFWRYDALNRVVDHVVDMDGSLKAAYATTHVLPDALTLDRTKHIVTTSKYNKLNAKVEMVGPKLTETAPGQFRTTVTKFEYDALQRLKKKIDDYSETPSAGYFNYETIYDYERAKNPGGSVFDSSGWKPTHITDPRGYRTEVTYDALYRPVEEKVEYKPDTYAVTNKDYDDVGNLKKVTAPLAHLTTGQTARLVTETTYDGLRRPLTVTEALGTPKAVTTKTDYTSTGFAWRTIADYDAAQTRLNLETRTEYDAAGRPVKVFAPKVDDALTAATTLVSPMTETRYDAAGNVDHVISPLGKRTDYAYDNRNRRYEEKLPTITDATTGLSSRPVRTTAYDGVGNVIAVQDARGFVTITKYDHARRPEKVIAPPVARLDGTTVHPETVTTYDKAGNILTLTDANGHVTTNTYDALGRLKTTLQKPDTNPAHDILVKNTYDPAGNRTEIEDGKNQITKFEYDGLNRNTKITDPALRSTQYTYDAVVKIERIDSENQKTRYDYDVRHRLETVIYDGRTVDNRTYVYDDLGRLKTVTEPNKPGNVATVAYTYDALGRQLTETSNGKTHTYGYDLANNRVTVTYGGTGTVLTSTYDAHNRLETLSELPASAPPASARLTSYGYDLNGNRVLQELPNSEEVDTQFDPLNRPVAITTTKASGALLLQLLQTYDPAGNLVRLTERHFGSNLKPRTVTNTYDNVNRLITEVNVEGSKTIATTYGFDRANNRTSKAVATTTGSGTTVIETIYGYNHLNQLETATEGAKVTSFTYDLNGNRETRSVQTEEPGILPVDTYTYDYENRLVGLTKNTPGGTGVYTYVYDYRTRRVERTESGTTTRMVFSGGVSVSEYAGGTPAVASAEYIRGSDWGGGVGGLLYSVRSGEPSFKHYNSRGDVISATDDAGTATWQGTYEAFGTRTQEAGSTLDRQKANTKEEDPTGLLNEGFRYRCLETGAFITRDPLGFVDGPNMYAYVVQNPWSKFDPHGLFKIWWDEVHETITQNAYNVAAQGRTIPKATSRAMQSGLKDGVRYPDMPEGLKTLAKVDSAHKKGTLTDEQKASTTYRSHFGDRQFWHSMSSSADTSAPDVKAKIVAQASEWFDAAMSKMDSNPEQSAREIGKVLHMVQDSHSESHVERNEKGEVVGFQDYGLQSGEAHGHADKIKEGFADTWSNIEQIPGAVAARDVSAKLIGAYLDRDKASFMKTIDANYTLTPDAYVKESKPEYKKPEDKK